MDLALFILRHFFFFFFFIFLFFLSNSVPDDVAAVVDLLKRGQRVDGGRLSTKKCTILPLVPYVVKSTP